MRECHLARSYALQPVRPQTLGLGSQMVGQTHRTVKTAAKLRDRLQPRLGRDLEPIENRLQALGYHTTDKGGGAIHALVPMKSGWPHGRRGFWEGFERNREDLALPVDALRRCLYPRCYRLVTLSRSRGGLR